MGELVGAAVLVGFLSWVLRMVWRSAAAALVIGGSCGFLASLRSGQISPGPWVYLAISLPWVAAFWMIDSGRWAKARSGGVLDRLKFSALAVYMLAQSAVMGFAILEPSLEPNNPDASMVGLGIAIAVIALEGVRRWLIWLASPVHATAATPPRPPPAANWSPPEQEEAGPNTSAWVEEKLRQAKRS